ncbi:MAG: copper oxidase [Acidobacteria bacterium]|nr:MAG: copper oxidase [Acidobacteriota bacterium]
MSGRHALVLGICLLFAAVDVHAQQCTRTVKADVVAIDQAYFINRLGTARPGGLLFALRSDVESTDAANSALQPGRVQLKSYKRPRPFVLRANVGDCVDIKFQNLLANNPTDPVQPMTRNVSLHITGMSLRESIASDGMWVGQNPPGATGMSGDVAPGASITYKLYASAEGSFLIYSQPGDFNNFGTQQLTMGLFGALNVEPAGAEWYRSQVTQSDLAMATNGSFPDGHPKINYDAVYPPGNPRAGKPILRMLDADNNVAHSDLTAVITGPHHGLFPGDGGNNPILPNRNWPFREVTVHYHESQDVVQAWAYFYPQNSGVTAHVPTVNAGSDSFAINYGLGGIAPEILSNRIRIGPSADCPECKFEEFFLSSWPQGDPGIVVDVPANAEVSTPCQFDAQFLGAPSLGGVSRPCMESRKLPTKAFYPDDPSNVYHSYLGDHVRFRILHAGAAVTHVHHHHAHQWLHSGTDQDSNYLDSQSIGPGASFTLELVYDGSGNRNLTAGDSIFHCHFYPHFASGMWALFRVHDVFEAGTQLDDAQRAASGARALPDPEIKTGTPIPAIVPLPNMPMAPLPSKVEIVDGKVKLDGDGFPGYPFYIPGIPGHRAPHPPLDFAVDPKTNEAYDGGLPRHLITGAVVSNEQHTLTDWSKDLSSITAFQLPEDGTPSEKLAMSFFGQHLHPSYTQNGAAQPFKVNGLPRGPQHGAPFADPAVDDGNAVGTEVPPYRGVDLQVDAVFNKAGWHYPQQRMMALWQDVNDFVTNKRPPEPLFFRAAANDVIEYWHTNLVPAYFELDDFEVRTPTDILGQHIHLVKFDVTSSDGAANGFNYEDGTFSPEEVRVRIDAINASGGLWNYARTSQTKLAPKTIAELGKGPGEQWVGAQATVQRWWVDPLIDTQGTDRTYMTVFTHDHFGPSTHQMVGLYGGLLVEPPNTKWTSLDGKTLFRDWTKRNDGGPTSYAANILYKNDDLKRPASYREFGLLWGDMQFVYNSTSRSQPDCYPGQTYNCLPVADGASYQGWSVVNAANANPAPPVPQNPMLTCFQNCTPPAGAPISQATPTYPATPSPFLIGDFGGASISMNYRTEPLPLRISDANWNQAAGTAGDLAYAFASIPRANPAFSVQPAGGSKINSACSGSSCFTFPQDPISGGMQATDPYTPLLAGYEGDNVQIRLLSGSHTSMHDFNMHGLRWLYQPFSTNSGYRNTQFIILSEHFETLFQLPQINAQVAADYLYNPTASYEGLTNGIWGILRSFNPSQQQTFLAPIRTAVAAPAAPQPVANANCILPQSCTRNFEVHVKVVPQNGLVYNSRGMNLAGGAGTSPPFVDPFAIVYTLGNQPVNPATVQPLVLRARAGDWIHVTLVNDLTGNEPVFNPSNAEFASRFQQVPYAYPYAVQFNPSASAGLHAQLVDYNVTTSDGANVGNNPAQTAKPNGGTAEYWWYAGKIEGNTATPVEFGAVNLLPADPLMQVYHGLFGALVIEPQGSRWVEDPQSPASATVFNGNNVYREFVLMVQDDVSMYVNQLPFYAANPLSAVNYKTEAAVGRYGALLNGALGLAAPPNWTNLSLADLKSASNVLWSSVDTTKMTANQLVAGDPQTPILRAPAGMPVRIHTLSPGGIGDNQQSFELTGHVWQETPYTNDSTKIGYNSKSYFSGLITGLGPTAGYPLVLENTPDGGGTPAGGKFRIAGDYLYRSWMANQFDSGIWGIFRVAPATAGAGFPDTVGITSIKQNGTSGYTVSGFTTVSPQNGKYAASVTFSFGGKASVSNGLWSYSGRGNAPSSFTVRSPLGGIATWGVESVRPLAMAMEAKAPAPMRSEPAVRKEKKPRQPK